MPTLKHIALLLSIASAALLAQDRVAYVSMARLFEEYYKTINANVLFEQRKIDYEDRMTLLRKSVEDAANDARAAEADAKNELVPQTTREEAMRKLRVRVEYFNKKRDEFEQARQQGTNELRRVQFETEEALVKDLSEFVKQYAKNYGYTHVWDVSGQSMNRMPTLLVYPESQEITDALIAQVNQGHENEVEAAKANLERLRKRNSEDKAVENK